MTIKRLHYKLKHSKTENLNKKVITRCRFCICTFRKKGNVLIIFKRQSLPNLTQKEQHIPIPEHRSCKVRKGIFRVPRTWYNFWTRQELHMSSTFQVTWCTRNPEFACLLIGTPNTPFESCASARFVFFLVLVQPVRYFVCWSAPGVWWNS